MQRVRIWRSFELLGPASPCKLTMSRISSGELAIVCDSRKPLGVVGACCATWLAIEGFESAQERGGR